MLQVIVQKLSEQESTKAGILQYADQIMEVLLQVLLVACLWRLQNMQILRTGSTVVVHVKEGHDMSKFVQVFACRSVTIHEEALLAVGSVTYATGKQFVKYMERFFPVLEQGLTNHQVGFSPPYF